jgi:hypothetical protein
MNIESTAKWLLILRYPGRLFELANGVTSKCFGRLSYNLSLNDLGSRNRTKHMTSAGLSNGGFCRLSSLKLPVSYPPQ